MKRHIYLRMKSVAEAREIFLSRFTPGTFLPPEGVLTVAARGRVTAAPVWARRSSPALHQAAMDGFAVAAAATFGATPEAPRRLRVGVEAFPVNTGHVMPPGTDAVIMVEQIPDPEAETITVEAPIFPWHNVRRVGEDLVAGEMVLPEGVRITPWGQGALLAAGVTRVQVRRRPRVVIIPTGSELIPASELDRDLPPGRLPEFNSVMLSGLVAEAGGVPEVAPICPDDTASLVAALQEALSRADMVLINAGSSAGTEDYTYQAVAALGEVLVHGVAMMPGKPTLLGVAQGSEEPAVFIVLEYNPDRPDLDTVVLVGKGITFDSGGISLKQADNLDRMRGDMAGGAAVLAAMQAIGRLGLPLHVVGLVPATENMPGGYAYKPGDVLTAMNGKTIEIISTDAEGRLILADALAYARRFEPKAVVDIATLTGACVVALGQGVAAGLFSNDEGLLTRLQAAGNAGGERVWPLPLYDEYLEKLESLTADVVNSAGRNSGVGSSAMFLKQFAEGYPWAHLDIAGMSFEERPDTPKRPPYLRKGGTGFGVRLLIQFLRDWAAAG